MSRRIGVGQGPVECFADTPQGQREHQQANDAYICERAKELLCELWKGGRIDIDTRCQGENALSAALHAIENPDLRNLTLRQGATLANQQWVRDQRRSSRDF